MTPITYISEQPLDYSNAIAAAETLEQLRATTEEWRELAGDAADAAARMTPAAFEEWRKGLALERQGTFAGEEFASKYAVIQMPEVMFKVAMVAAQYCVPWGCAYIRLKEAGKLPKSPAGRSALNPAAAWPFPKRKDAP